MIIKYIIISYIKENVKGTNAQFSLLNKCSKMFQA